MQVAQVLAGYSLGEADLLRRAMGKKNMEEMAKQKDRFVSGAVGRGHDERKSSDLFDLLAKFAEYGFNKSHSAAYGFVAYQTAWLKANHRAEYMAALLSIDAGDSDKVLLYMGDCRRAGIRVLPPDVNLSSGRFDVPRDDRRCIRFGLHAVKGIGENATLSILEARNRGPFRDYNDLLLRMDYRKVNKKVLEALIKSGACDSLGEPRARMIAALEGAMAAAQEEQAVRAAGQVSLFGGGNGATRPSFKMPAVGEWPVSERMRMEREALGFYLTGHPAEAFSADAQRWGVYKTTEVAEAPEGNEIVLSGIVAQKRIIKTKSGQLMAFVQLEDLHGGVEVTFFSKPFERSRAVLDLPKPILVRGKVERREGVAKLLAEGAELMEDARERRTTRIAFWLRAEELTAERVEELHALVAQNRGSCTTVIVVDDPSAARPYRATIPLPRDCAAAASPRLDAGVQALFGRPDCVRYE
jgi:DNA polymerase-3 subunit alpha